MKKSILLLLVALILAPLAMRGQDVTVVNQTEDALTIDVTVFDVKEKEAVNAAMPFVYYNIFFRGFPDSTYFRDPLVGTAESFVETNPQYFKNMEDGRFNTFVTNARLVEYNKKAKPKYAVVRFTINMRGLIRDLETQGVKRRFGL